jgi:hypothetical protein
MDESETMRVENSTMRKTTSDSAQAAGEQRSDAQAQLEVHELVFGRFKNAQPRKRHRPGAFQDIDDQHRDARCPAQHPESVGGPGVSAAKFPYVNIVKGLADPYRGWDRTQQVTYEKQDSRQCTIVKKSRKSKDYFKK